MRALVGIKERYKGCWPSIHNNIGIDSHFLNGKHQQCPMCGGRNRFRYDNKDGSGNYFCNQCGHGQGIDLVMRFLNINFNDAVNEIRYIRGDIRMEVVKVSDETEKNKARIHKIHAGLKIITPDSPAALYFAKRGITVLPEKNCYWHPSLEYWSIDDDNKPFSLGKFPVIVSVFRNSDNATSSYHVTYITVDGQKADVPTQKKILPPVAPLSGCAIQLFPATDTIGIAEGLESSLSAHQEMGIPVWMAGNSGLMEKIVVPDSIKNIYIITDEDTHFAGAKSAYILANRLASKYDRTFVKVVRYLDRVQVIDSGGNFDANDYVIFNTDH